MSRTKNQFSNHTHQIEKSHQHDKSNPSKNQHQNIIKIFIHHENKVQEVLEKVKNFF